MRRTAMLLGLLCLALLSSSGPADEPPAATPKRATRTDLEITLQNLLEDHGAEHPKVLRVVRQLALVAQRDKDQASAEPAITKKLLLVAAKGTGAMLKDARVRSLGGRSFVVGLVVESDMVQSPFVGNTVWIPLEDVTQMVEMEARGRGK
jgi:hypothetical protein